MYTDTYGSGIRVNSLGLGRDQGTADRSVVPRVVPRIKLVISLPTFLKLSHKQSSIFLFHSFKVQ